jgi:hypothetical protein
MSWKKVSGWGFLVLLALAGWPVRADDLETKNGERLTGRILSETADSVEFESTTFGKLRVEKKNIVRLERSTPPQPGAPAEAPAGQAVASETPPAAPAPAQPQQAKDATPQKVEWFMHRLDFLKKWKSSLDFGLTYRRGQDSDNNFDIRFRSERLNPLAREYLFEYRYYRKDDVSADGVKTVDDDNTVAEFRFRQALRPRWFFQANARYYRDPMVNLFNEGTLTGGPGYRIFEKPTFKMSVIPAAGAQYADYGPEERGWHFVLGGYQDLQWDFAKFFKIRQTLYFFQDPWNRASHALRFHVEQSQRVSKYFSLGFAYDYTFDGEVGGYIKQNQQRLGVNLGLDF